MIKTYFVTLKTDINVSSSTLLSVFRLTKYVLFDFKIDISIIIDIDYRFIIYI